MLCGLILPRDDPSGRDRQPAESVGKPSDDGRRSNDSGAAPNSTRACSRMSSQLVAHPWLVRVPAVGYSAASAAYGKDSPTEEHPEGSSRRLDEA